MSGAFGGEPKDKEAHAGDSGADLGWRCSSTIGGRSGEPVFEAPPELPKRARAEALGGEGTSECLLCQIDVSTSGSSMLCERREEALSERGREALCLERRDKTESESAEEMLSERGSERLCE